MQTVRTFVFTLVIVSAVSGFAQTIKLVHPSIYVERYANPKVSGTLLVGLRTRAATGNFQPQTVSIRVSPELRGKRVCVSIASRDGLYYAENLYQVPADAPAVSTFETITHYGPQLNSYSAQDVALNIRVTADCNSADDGQILPAQEGHDTSGPVLVASLNADPEHLSLELLRAGMAPLRGECATAAGSRVAFTSTCEFRAAALPPGIYDLVVHLRERTRIRDTHFSVRIP